MIIDNEHGYVVAGGNPFPFSFNLIDVAALISEIKHKKENENVC